MEAKKTKGNDEGTRRKRKSEGINRSNKVLTQKRVTGEKPKA
jgi:hypothetical protein